MNQLKDKFEKAANDNRDVFLAHMEEKYGVSFLPISYSGSGVVTKEEFRCYAEGTDRERDYIRVFRREENGEEVFYDDYFGIIVREEYQSRVQNLCDETIGSAKAYIYRYTASFFDNDLTNGSTIDDAIALGEKMDASKYIFFEVELGNEEGFKATCDQICQALSENQLPGAVKFIGLSVGELENITEENYLTYLPSMVKPDGSICLMMDSCSVTSQ